MSKSSFKLLELFGLGSIGNRPSKTAIKPNIGLYTAYKGKSKKQPSSFNHAFAYATPNLAYYPIINYLLINNSFHSHFHRGHG